MPKEQLVVHFVLQRLTPVVLRIGDKQAQRSEASMKVMWDVSLEQPQRMVGTWCWIIKQ